MLRLLFNPDSQTISNVTSLIQKHHFNQKVIGIHIRSGGLLANYRESAYWITYDELPSLVSFINNTIVQNHLPHKIYLTSDSDIITRYIKSHLKHYHYITGNPYQRYHTTVGNSESFKAALFDSLALSQAHTLIYTKGSSFSKEIVTLSIAKSKYKLPYKRRRM